jgi:hypothetical protein
MSLVGSLEDLGLGDILQIISLSRKSGVLLLRSDRGEGRIIFREGLIRGAFHKGDSTHLRDLVAGLETVPKAELDAACEQARAQSVSLATLLIDRSLMSAESLEELRRENVEKAVMQMFRWATGEFSFEVREAIPDEETFSSSGVNPQYLALDFTRIVDEGGCEVDEDPSCDSLVFDGEGESDADGAAEMPARAGALWAGDAVSTGEDTRVAEETIVTAEELTATAEDATLVGGEEISASEGALSAQEAIVTIEEAYSTEEPIVADEPIAEPGLLEAGEEVPAAPPPSPAPPRSRLVPPVVVIDPDLAVLEWVKQGLADTFPRVHIFQRSELGISRIRQYLARAEIPLVLLSDNAPADPLSGAHGCAELIQRLKAHARQMPIVMLVEPGADPISDRGKAPPPDGIAEKPTASHLADPRCLPLRTEYVAGLRDVLVACSCQRSAATSRASPGSLSPDTLARLKEVSARMRDSSSRGRVLPQVLQFASETFSRVAMFMIRDDTAQGIAQVGLPKAGGPDQRGLREVTLPHREPAWFRRVFDSRTPGRAAPSDDGDQRLAVLLGNAIPEEAYVAPIESGEHVVALLYADNLPGGKPIGDTSALEVVLHEAGLALDRAWMKRALEEASD